MSELSQRTRLAQRIPDGFIERTQGQTYAAHHVVNQWLLGIVGPFDFHLVEILRGPVLSRIKESGKPSFSDAHSTVVLGNVIVGGVFRLVCEIDGRQTIIEQTGDVEHPENWQHDGARLKDAESDALKRCAMRLGLGLHLWAQEHYILDRRLMDLETPAQESEAGVQDHKVRGRPSGSDLGPPPQTAQSGQVAEQGQRGQDRQRRPDLPGRTPTPEVAAGPPAAASGTRSAQARGDGGSSRAPAAGQPAKGKPAAGPPLAEDWFTATCKRLLIDRADAVRFLATRPEFEPMLGESSTNERIALMRQQSRDGYLGRQARAALEEFATTRQPATTVAQATLGGGS